MKSTGNTLKRVYPEANAGGFSRLDGTIQFYQRIHALLQPDNVVLDLGAGRGQAHYDDPIEYRRQLRNFKGKARKVIGVDVDEVVFENPSLDEALLIRNGNLPLEAESVDIIFSDYTLEHVSEPGSFAMEIHRVLKPGGWFCARTPNKYGYISIFSRLTPRRSHEAVLSVVQPNRKAEDVFPTSYLLNTRRDIRQHLPETLWNHHIYGWNAEPAYFGSSVLLWSLARVAFAITPPAAAATLMIFSQKTQ